MCPPCTQDGDATDRAIVLDGDQRYRQDNSPIT